MMRMVEVALCRAISDQVNSLCCLSGNGCIYTWVNIADVEGHLPACGVVPCWSAFWISAFMCPLLASYHSYLGCCRWSHLAIIILSFSGPLLLQRMKEKCRIMKDMQDYSAMIVDWVVSREKWHLSRINAFKYCLVLNNLKVIYIFYL